MDENEEELVAAAVEVVAAWKSASWMALPISGRAMLSQDDANRLFRAVVDLEDALSDLEEGERCPACGESVDPDAAHITGDEYFHPACCGCGECTCRRDPNDPSQWAINESPCLVHGR